jgi:transcriptional regulator with GAF, ATPase, and Fis domain
VILAEGGRLRLDLALTGALPPRHGGAQPVPAVRGSPLNRSDVVTAAEIRRRERDNLVAALERARWKIYGSGGAAELLGLKPTTLTSRMKALGIRRPRD